MQRWRIVATASALALAGCETLGSIEDSIGIGQGRPEEAARDDTQRGPTPVPSAAPTGPLLTPTEALASATAGDWRPIAGVDLLIIDLGDRSRVVIQLAPRFAPVHVANIRAFARGRWWDRTGIYRVQDNYVVQWGNGETEKGLPAGVIARPPAEYERPLGGQRPLRLPYADAYAQAVGFLEGWPVGWSPRTGLAHLTHCYAMVGVGRDLAPDTGTGGELYAVIGHAPRHLDRNIAVVGRVIEGIDRLSARPRGSEALGMYKDKREHIPIARARLASDMPLADRPSYEALDTESLAFGRYMTARANRRDSFFIRPAGGADLCNVPVPVRRRG